jgi:hypothetical protein
MNLSDEAFPTTGLAFSSSNHESVEDIQPKSRRDIFEKLAGEENDDLTAMVSCGVRAFLKFCLELITEKILLGMKEHRKSLSIQTIGFEALVLLTSNDEMNRLEFLASDGLATVCDTMRVHGSKYFYRIFVSLRGSASISQYGCWLLYFAACTQTEQYQGRDMVLDAGGIDIITSAMIKHVYSSETQVWLFDCPISLPTTTSSAQNRSTPAGQSTSSHEGTPK